MLLSISVGALVLATTAAGQTPGFDPILKPGKDDRAAAGAVYTIVWEPSQPGQGKVTLSLLGGATPQTLQVLGDITTGLDNQAGKFDWAVDPTLGMAATYGIKITLEGDQAGATFQYSNPFHIDPVPVPVHVPAVSPTRTAFAIATVAPTQTPTQTPASMPVSTSPTAAPTVVLAPGVLTPLNHANNATRGTNTTLVAVPTVPTVSAPASASTSAFAIPSSAGSVSASASASASSPPTAGAESHRAAAGFALLAGLAAALFFTL